MVFKNKICISALWCHMIKLNKNGQLVLEICFLHSSFINALNKFVYSKAWNFKLNWPIWSIFELLDFMPFLDTYMYNAEWIKNESVIIFFFFWFGFYGPFKNISLISSRSFIEGGRKPENPEKNHLTIRKQNLAFPHMTRARLEPQRWET